MREHIYNYINVSKLIELHKPKLVLELGSAGLQTTIQLWGLMYKTSFKLITVDDNPQTIFVPEPYEENWYYYQGISYEFLKLYPDIEMDKVFKGKFDMVLIDTDHNYWTLDKEIKALEPHLTDDAIILFHDTRRKNPHDTILYRGYACEYEYPIDKINTMRRPMVEAVDEWVERSDYKVIRETQLEEGCMAISKVKPYMKILRWKLSNHF